MWAVYVSSSSATQANVLSDLVALLTGTTDKTTLSASCVQASTVINAGYDSAGWSVYDASAGTNSQCLRALNQDGTTYKYLTLTLTSTTVVSMAIAEAWNSSTHVGTNTTTAQSSTWAATSQTTWYVYASAKNVFIHVSGQNTLLYAAEATRDTIASTYPCHVLATATPTGIGSGGSSTFSAPRIKAANAAGDLTNVTTIGSVANGGLVSNNTTSVYRDSAESLYMEFFNIAVVGNTTANGYQTLGKNYDILITGVTAANDLDEIVYNGKTYIFKKVGTFGYAAFLLPKG